MMVYRAVLVAALTLALVSCKMDETGTSRPGNPRASADEDDDRISNADEGFWTSVDTDGDTIPDYLDDDSDGDSLPDMAEAGDWDLATPPVDSDWDGVPDFRDPDSDDNGILDRDEGSGDMDADGIPDFADRDDDNDVIPDDVEIGDTPHSPPDTDGDGIPDHRDGDSDGDTISDEHEGVTDTDGDTIRDYVDLDTDGDGILDSVEAGDPDVRTPPRDLDGDGTPDFRDFDSDGDGLPDVWEQSHGCNPFSDDTDEDGVPDILEVAVCEGGCTGYECPGSRPYVFIVPFNLYGTPPDEIEEPSPAVEHVVLESSGQGIDVFFSIHASSSMASKLHAIHSGLRTTVIPGIRAVHHDAWFGVGRYMECQSTSCTEKMEILQPMTGDVSDVEAALSGWVACGWWDPPTQFLYALATGDVDPFTGWGGVIPATWSCAGGDYGWPCFREDARPIIVHIADQPFTYGVSHCVPPYSISQAVTALNSIDARYIGVDAVTGGWGAHADMVTVAYGTSSVDVMGAPYVFDISSDGSGLGAQVVDAVREISGASLANVTYRLRDGPGDLVDTVRAFVDRVEPSVLGGFPDVSDPYLVCEGGHSVADLHPPHDGEPDSFTGVPGSTPLCFDIHVKTNHTVPATPSPQIFTCEIDALVDGGTVSDTREIYFFVPPAH